MAEQIKIFTLDNLTYYDSKLKVFIDEKLAEVNAAIEAGDAKSFKAVAIEGNVLKFYRVDPITEEAVAAYEVTLPEQDLSHLMELVDGAVEGNVATFGAGGQVVDSGIKAADIATKDEVNAVDAKADENKAAIDLINDDKDGILVKAQTYADGKDAAIAAAQTAADEAQADVDALAGKVGEVPEGSTVMGIITNIQENAYDDTEIRGLIDGLEENKADKTQVATDIASAKTELEGKITEAKTAADEAQAHSEGVAGDLETETSERKAADEAQIERIETLEGQIIGLSGAMHFEGVKDAIPEGEALADYENGDVIIVGNKEYVMNNGAFVEFGDVSAQAEAITELTGRMDGAEGEIDALQEAETEIRAAVATKAEQTALDEAVEALEQADAEQVERIEALEGDTHTHANQAELDLIQTGDKAKWDEAAGKAHTHENAEELDKIEVGDKAKWDEAAGKAHVHENAEVLDGITAEQVAAWDKAEENAIAKANELNEAMNLRVSTVEESLAEGGATANAIKQAQDGVDAINAKLGEVPEDKTVVQMIEESVYDDTQVKADISKNAEDLAALEKKHDEEKLALDGAIADNTAAIEALAAKYVPLENSDIDALFPAQTV